MADLQVETECQQRYRQRKHGWQQAMQSVGRRRRCLCVGVSEQDAALDLQSRRRGFAVAEIAAGALALDFGELVAVDRELAVEPTRRCHARAQQRDQQRTDRRRGEKREQEFQHQRPSSERSRSRSSSLSGGKGAVARRRKAVSMMAAAAISSTNGAPSHSSNVPSLKGGFSST